MPNGTYGGVRGRKTKVGRKLLRFPPTRLFLEQFLKKYSEKHSEEDEEGTKEKYYPYCGIIIWYLQKKLQALD